VVARLLHLTETDDLHSFPDVHPDTAVGRLTLRGKGDSELYDEATLGDEAEFVRPELHC
jgi:hypothetical protein